MDRPATSTRRDAYGTETGKNIGSEWAMEGDRMEGDEVPLFATRKMSPSKAHLPWKVIDGR